MKELTRVTQPGSDDKAAQPRSLQAMPGLFAKVLNLGCERDRCASPGSLEQEQRV